MLSSFELSDAYTSGIRQGHTVALRAVEAAVRADQIEKDAGIAKGLSDAYGATADRMLNEGEHGDSTRYSHYAIAHSASAAAIRAQLEGTTDE